MGTRIRTRITPKIRVMSFVMAFVILVVSLPIWIGNTGTKVKAADLTGDGNHIYSDTKTTTMTAMGNDQTSANDNRFVYTGKITKAQTELFDYVSDYELINNSYNNILHTEGGYDDEYTHLNQAISQSNNATEVTAQSENITINYTPHSTTFSGHSIFMHCWREGGTGSTTFPGIEMVYDTANSRYTCTFNPDFFGFSASAEPDRFIFSDNNGVQTGTYSKSTTKNNTYSFVTGETKIRFIAQKDQDTINSVQVYMWDDEGHENAPWPGVNMSFVGTNGEEEVYEYTVSGISFRPRDFKFSINHNSWETGNAGSVIDMGYTYNCYYYQSHNDNDKPLISVPEGSFGASSTASGPESGSKPIYDTLYTNPLYFGCFWRSNSADTIASNSNNPGYNISNKAAYNNFWWQANIGLKNTGTTANDNPSETDTNGFRVRGTASTQGLVYSSLSVNDNLVDVNGKTELPYFDKTSSLVTSGLMKYYDKDETGDNIHFPFYEVKANAKSYVGNGNSEKKIAGEYKEYSGSGTATTQYAKFYQFDSKESNVRFEIAQNESNVEDPSLHKGHFVETSRAITHDEKAGYFPFNNINNNDEKKHNLGVGTKFEMTFKLQPDGCVGVVDSSGNDLDTNDYKTRVHTIFEFEGDDDLWVFIDGKLVLDMGGAHFKSHGVIDFADQTATVDKAITIGDHREGYTGNPKDDLGVDYTSNAQISNTAPSTDDFKNRLKSGSFRTVTLEGGGTREEYDPTVSHKITVFYMERGMLDSNLLVRFNYTPESNFSKMKIAEVTDYSAINTGLQPFFQEAAENDVFMYDVFMYTVENKGTKKADVLTNSAAYPTNENRTRKNEGENTVQEKLAVYDSNANPEPILYTSPGHVDPNDSTKWIDDTGEWSNVSGTSYLWVDGFILECKNIEQACSGIGFYNSLIIQHQI